MLLHFDATNCPPLQPFELGRLLPKYVPSAERDAHVAEDARYTNTFLSALYGSPDADAAWFAYRMACAQTFAKEDAAGTGPAPAAEPKRSRGRPHVYPIIEGESDQERRLRLMRERARNRRAGEKHNTPECELLWSRVQQVQQEIANATAYAAAKREELRGLRQQLSKAAAAPQQ